MNCKEGDVFLVGKEVIKLGILGMGTVGTGVVEILTKNRQSIKDKVRSNIMVKTVLVKDASRQRSVNLEGIKVTTEASDILNDPEIDIVVEVMGGVDQSREYIEEALKQGKFVVTANKDLMAQKGIELLKIAKENNKNIYYEASVGGGIPLIRPLKHCLAANRVEKIMGIINGTTNYILTQMTLKKKDLAVALKEAQDLGFAEQDPSSDVEGKDAAFKLTILAANAFQSKVNISDIYTEGIMNVKLRDILYADELGYVVKLLAIGEEGDAGVSLRVHPTLIPKTHPLAGVYDEFNAVFLEGDAVGEVMFYGRGAGSLPTGSAIVADIIDVVRNINHETDNGIAEINFKKKRVIAMEDQISRFYLRLKAKDQPGVFANLATAFGEHQVSLDMIIQKRSEENTAEIVLVTHDVLEKQFNEALRKVKAMDSIKSINSLLRVMER